MKIKDGFSVASLVLGIVGLVTSFIFIGFFPALLGLIFGIIAIRKNQPRGMAIGGIICSIIGLFIAIVVFIGTPTTSEQTGTISSSSVTSSISESKEDSSSQNSSNLADQMDVKLYSYDNWEYKYVVLVITNNSTETVRIESNILGKGADGSTLGAASSDQVAVMSGKTVALLHIIDDGKDITDYDYSLQVKKDTYYDSVFDTVTVEETILDKKVVLTAKNNGDKDAEFVEAIALFFRNGKLVSYGSTYLIDDDCKLKAGATYSAEIECYAEHGFDDVKLYYNGRREK